MWMRVLLNLQRHGLKRTLFRYASKTVNLFVIFKILRGVAIDRCDPSFFDCPEGYTASFLSAEQLRQFSNIPGNELQPSFTESALEKGDECMAVRFGDELASYTWYAFSRTPIQPPELALQFSPEYVYNYKGFTSFEHRGKRLLAIGATLALRHYLSKGYKGLVAYIEADNFDSLKSSFRMGYSQFGSIYVIRIFGRYFTWASPGCRNYAFELQKAIETLPESNAAAA